MASNLLTTILNQDIRHTNFFNGRVLTAEDLSQEQDAHRKQRQLLGKAIGQGVAYGLRVKRAQATANAARTVTITAGLALNGHGQTLALANDTDVLLASEPEPTGPATDLFVACKTTDITTVPTGTGVYILVAAPSSAYQERAPKVSPGSNGAARGCSKRYAVEGLKFRLVKLDVSNQNVAAGTIGEDIRKLLGQTTDPGLSKLRNLLAHFCLGTAETTGFSADLLPYLGSDGARLTYGGLDKLREFKCLSDCDVPLAMIYWASDAITFIDMWSVRRRLHYHTPTDDPPFPIPDRHTAEVEAAFLQFQDQIASLTKTGTPQGQISAIAAKEYFGYLPAAGLIPLAAFGATRGFNLATFFSGRTYRPLALTKGVNMPPHMEGAQARTLIRDAFYYPCIDLGSKEMIWLYIVRENMQAVRDGAANPPRPYILFTNGQMPYIGDARYDLAYWNFSNYA